MTYGELDDRSNRLAHHLVACGVGREIPVAVCVRPSLDVLVALLAIWKAGGVYLPLDPTHPPALVTRMLDEARPRLVLTTTALADLVGSCPRFCFDADGDLLRAMPAGAPERDGDAVLDAAYLFYTSGTTGRSKGVVATQGNLAQYVHSAAQKYGFGPGDVFVSLARYTFSISLFELVSPLACGGSLRILERDAVLTPERLFAALDGVTVLHAGPSLLGSLFRHLRALPEMPALPRMRHASSGGDMVSPSVMEEMKRVFPNAELFVIYGCTEVSCMGTTFPIPRDRKVTRTFVGRAFPDVTARVLDPSGRVVPFGVVGEIAFAGKGISRGYLDRPELTAERFAPIDGRRFYRTGDMGRLHADGSIEILGRRDFQVQLRGIRIELAGIEKMALELGLAAQCAVVARSVGEGDLRLVAYAVKPAAGGLAAFRRALAAELPDYMLPHHLVALEAMPLTVNGKLDRHRLMEMPLEARVEAAGSGEGLQGAIAEAFARVLKLGLGQIGTQDTFFDLGGDSLLGVYVLQEIQRVTGVAIPPHVLFESGTVEALARRALRNEGTVEAEDADEEPSPILLNGGSSNLPLFMLSGVNIYRELAQRLEGECAAYGLFLRREVGAAVDPTAGSHSVEDLARDYVRVIRRQQPEGPYRLLGYSFAGIVAYEVAQQLRAAGEEIRFLGLVDAFLPEWTLGWKFRLAQLERLGTVPARDLVAFVQRRWRESRDPTYADLGLYHGDENVGPLEERRFALNGDAAADYMTRIRSLPLAVTVVMSGGRLRKDPLKSRSGGWRRYVRQLDLHNVDADHFPLIRTDPHVSTTARLIAKGIHRAEWIRRRRRSE
jgi:amino acid adenylation domain-containing protein